MIRHLIELFQKLILGLSHVLLPWNENKVSTIMSRSNFNLNEALSPIKNSNCGSPWSKSITNCIISPYKGEANDLMCGNESKTIQHNCNDKASILKIKCPKCSYEIKLVDSFNLITCMSPFYCRGTTKFCRQCMVVITDTNENLHFKHGYYKPLCTLAQQHPFKPHFEYQHFLR